MRKTLLLSTVLGLVLACSVAKKPEFTGLENIKVSDFDKETLQISAYANFKNPNVVGGKLKADGIKLFVNDMETAVLRSEEFDVPPKKDFQIPLVIQVPTDSIYGEKGIISLLQSVLTKQVKIQYKGPIKYEVIGFSHQYQVDKTEIIEIKF